jgi:hypothetical protein
VVVGIGRWRRKVVVGIGRWRRKVMVNEMGQKMEVSNRQRRAAGSEGMTRGRKGRLHSLIHVKRRPMPNE